MPGEPKTFREASCERLGISADAFQERVLWECFYPRRIWLGKLLWRFDRHYFDADFELIRMTAKSTDLSEIYQELNDQNYRRSISGLWRGVLCVRLSGQRLTDFAAKFIK